jgi:nitrite reductase/ring-hydroxylating ferredoxin subunit
VNGTRLEASKTVEIGDLSDLPEGVIKVAELEGGRRVGVVRVGDGVRAFSLRCPHRGGPLERGVIRRELTSRGPGDATVDAERCVLTCPWHKWEYSLETGSALFDDRRRIWVSECLVADGRVSISRAALR